MLTNDELKTINEEFGLSVGDCPCDLRNFVKTVWSNCDLLTRLLPIEQLRVGEFLGDPNQPYGVVEEFTSNELSCNSSGGLQQVPMILTFHCAKRKLLATLLGKAVYRKFHRKFVGESLQCGVICGISMTTPQITETDYQYMVRIQATVRLSVSL